MQEIVHVVFCKRTSLFVAILGSTFASNREPNTKISSFVFAPSPYARAEMASSTLMTQTIQDLLCSDGSLMLAMPPGVARAKVAKRERVQNPFRLYDKRRKHDKPAISSFGSDEDCIQGQRKIWLEIC
jgi:hypothetical protein